MIKARSHGGAPHRAAGLRASRPRVLVATRSRNSGLGVAAVTLAAWGLLVGASLSAPLLGAGVGLLLGAVLRMGVDRQPSAPPVVDRRSTFETPPRNELDELDARWSC